MRHFCCTQEQRPDPRRLLGAPARAGPAAGGRGRRGRRGRRARALAASRLNSSRSGSFGSGGSGGSNQVRPRPNPKPADAAAAAQAAGSGGSNQECRVRPDPDPAAAARAAQRERRGWRVGATCRLPAMAMLATRCFADQKLCDMANRQPWRMLSMCLGKRGQRRALRARQRA